MHKMTSAGWSWLPRAALVALLPSLVVGDRRDTLLSNLPQDLAKASWRPFQKETSDFAAFEKRSTGKDQPVVVKVKATTQLPVRALLDT